MCEFVYRRVTQSRSRKFRTLGRQVRARATFNDRSSTRRLYICSKYKLTVRKFFTTALVRARRVATTPPARGCKIISLARSELPLLYKKGDFLLRAKMGNVNYIDRPLVYRNTVCACTVSRYNAICSTLLVACLTLT